MTIANDDGSSGLPPLNGPADPRWTIYSPPGKGHHNMFTTTLPVIAPSTYQTQPKFYQPAPRPHDTVPDIKGNRPYEINRALFPLHGFIEEPSEWKVQRKDASNVVQQRVGMPSHHVDAAPAFHQYPENIEATRIIAARRVKKAYINEVRMEISHHFQPATYTEEELRQIDLDNQRNALLERKDAEAQLNRVPAPPSCPKPSGGNARARKYRKAKKCVETTVEN